MFWDRFEELCRVSGKKPSPVGKEIGVSATAVSKWKEGTIPNGEILMKIADYFNVSVDYLLGRIDEPNSNSIQTGDIHNNIQGDNNGNNSINIGNQTAGMSEDAKALVEMIEGLTLLQRSKVVVMIDEMRKGA